MRAPRVGLSALLALAAGACAHNAAGPPPAQPAAQATDAEGVFTIVSSCGFRVLVNEGDAHFTIDLDGTVTLDEHDGGDYLAMDDVIVQIVHTSRAQLGPAAVGKDGLDLLRAHEAWESAYLAEQLHAKVEPKELSLDSKGGSAKLEGIMWWFPLADRAGPGGAPVHRYWAYATFVVGDHVVGLSARAERGLEPVDLMQRLARWMATLAPSSAKLSPEAVSAAVRASFETDKCPDVPGAIGVDRRLRLDEIPRAEREGIGRAAEQLGGVERQVAGKRLRYRNHICRFEVVYPDDEWKDFLVRDFSNTGCMANLATPLIYDPDAKEKITNAVVLTVARPTAEYGAAEMQGEVVESVKKRGATIGAAKKPLLPGAIDATYAADSEGTHFVGEIATVKRGELLYSVHFNSTRGTEAAGRKHLQRWLAGLRLDVP
jgi:hypothetical protein